MARPSNLPPGVTDRMIEEQSCAHEPQDIVERIKAVGISYTRDRPAEVWGLLRDAGYEIYALRVHRDHLKKRVHCLEIELEGERGGPEE